MGALFDTETIMEQQQYEVAWSGSSWRSYPQPVVAVSHDGPRVTYTGTAPPTWNGRELVYAVLSNGGWHSVKGVIQRTGLSDRQVRMHLMHGARDGRLERMDGAPVRQGLRPVFLYRKRQAAEVAA